ncbi:RNA-binding domain-containing protein, partial [Jaminaea rosea]
MIKGMTSADESDEDEDEDNSSDESDSEGIKRFSDIATMKLPSSKDDAAVRARLSKLEARRKAQPAAQKIDRAVLYVGHLPKHFTETPLRSYLSQFGTITRLRLSRNKKTGASKHYAFVEFADEEVARIVQETMDNYLIMGQLLRVKPLSRDQIHPKMWVGANRTFRKIPAGRRAREQHDGAKSVEGKQRAETKLLERQERKRAALKEAGIDY